jgi:hypothetical protein
VRKRPEAYVNFQLLRERLILTELVLTGNIRGDLSSRRVGVFHSLVFHKLEEKERRMLLEERSPKLSCQCNKNKSLCSEQHQQQAHEVHR